MNNDHEVETFVYKRVAGLDLSFDVHFSPAAVLKRSADIQAPAVVFFHPGGLSVGSRDTWIPKWLLEPMIARGYLFIIPEYQLMPPATGHEIQHDIQDLFIYLPNLKIPLGSHFVQVDCQRVAFSGSSGGGLCCYLAVSDKFKIKPRAIFSLYGMGGDLFSPHYLKPKTQVFFRGYELLDPAVYSKYLYPYNEGPLDPIVHSPPVYHPKTHPTNPGYPADPRMKVPQLYLQMGEYLNYYTGEHEPSLSALLRDQIADEQDPELRAQKARDAVPIQHHSIIPQLNVASSHWPPTLLFHGTADTAVPVAESRNLKRLLEAAGIEATLVEVDGQEHSFDLRPSAHEEFGDVFDQAVAFLTRHLSS